MGNALTYYVLDVNSDVNVGIFSFEDAIDNHVITSVSDITQTVAADHAYSCISCTPSVVNTVYRKETEISDSTIVELIQTYYD